VKTTKTPKTTADIFADRVATTIAEFKQEFENAKGRFLAAAKNCPSWAFQCYGESVVYHEEAFKSLDHVRACLGQVGVEYATRKEAVQAALDHFRDTLVRAATASQSSSGFANGVELARRQGIGHAVSAIERLVNHEFI